jgi:hypothetical protein
VGPFYFVKGGGPDCNDCSKVVTCTDSSGAVDAACTAHITDATACTTDGGAYRYGADGSPCVFSFATEIGTLTTTDPDANLGNGGTSTGCCASFTYTSVSVTKTGEDETNFPSANFNPGSDIVLAASTGIITVGRATITTSAQTPTRYILTAKVNDDSGSEGLYSENVAITIEVSSLSDSFHYRSKN